MTLLANMSSSRSLLVGSKNRAVQVMKYALMSRVLVWVITLVANFFVSPYDTSSSVAIFGDKQPTAVDKAVWALFGQYTRWDAAYFLRIAEVGYEYEKNHAFGPMLPIVANLVRKCLCMSYFDGDGGLWSVKTSLLVSGLLHMHIHFVGAAWALYQLSKVVLKNEKQAFVSSILFCFNPASIFMSAYYSETFFAFCSFVGMLCYERGVELKENSDKNNSRTSILTDSLCVGEGIEALGAFLFFSACAFRANGLVLVGFPVYHFAKGHVWPGFSKRFLKLQEGRFSSAGPANGPTAGFMLLATAKYLVLSIIGILPYFGMQLYARTLYCNGDSTDRAWCKSSNIYAHVQEAYWDLGPFAYYRVSKIPNFVLALPVVTLSLWTFRRYIGRLRHRHGCASQFPAIDRVTAVVGLNNQSESLDLPIVGFHSHRVAPYVWYMFVLTVFGLVMMHVEVLTRFLFASSPPLYWFAATLINKRDPRSHYILGYFAIYFVMGSILFSTFYPWT